jgi:hypothetical protein
MHVFLKAQLGGSSQLFWRSELIPNCVCVGVGVQWGVLFLTYHGAPLKVQQVLLLVLLNLCILSWFKLLKALILVFLNILSKCSSIVILHHFKRNLVLLIQTSWYLHLVTHLMFLLFFSPWFEPFTIVVLPIYIYFFFP